MPGIDIQSLSSPNTQFITLGSSFSIGTSFTFLVLLRLNVNAAGNLRFFAWGPVAATGERRLVFLSSPVNTIRLVVQRATTNTRYDTNNALVLGRPYWIAATYVEGAATEAHVYLCDASSLPLVEASYAATINGSGSSSASPTSGGFGETSGGAQSPGMTVYFGTMLNEVLSLGDLNRLILSPTRLGPAAAGLWYPGQQGPAIVADQSGNQNIGVVTKAAISNDWMPRFYGD